MLGGMLLSKDAIADVVEALRSADFYKPAHSLVFDAIVDLYSRGEPADTITVAAELERAGSLGRVGGAVYLHTLIACVPTAANAGYYAQIVAEKAILRRLVEAGTRIVQLGYGGAEGEVGGGEVDEIVDRAQAEIYDVTERRTSEDYVILEELLQPTMDEIDAIAMAGGRAAGVPTGFADLDTLTNGLHPGQMIIVAARPGIGKSLLCMNIARHAAVKHHQAAVIFSLEMSQDRDHDAAAVGRGRDPVVADAVRVDERAGLAEDRPADERDLRRAAVHRRLAEHDDDGDPGQGAAAQAAERPEVDRRGLPAADDVRQAGGIAAAGGQRVLPADEAAGQGARGAGDRDLAAQPRPGAAHRQAAHARRTCASPGSLEQDADMVILVHRPDAWEADDPRAGEADLIIAKHRNGPTATIAVAHQLHYSRFADLAG